MCATIKNRLKTDDLIGRIIDDEFSILIENDDEEEGLSKAEVIRQKPSALPGIYSQSEYRLRISEGLTSILPADREVTDLVNRADRDFWIAKAEGRNQNSRVV